MERLTARSPKNNMAYLVKVKRDEQDVESPYPNTLKAIIECFQKLAEYEDTGQTPVEVKRLADGKAVYEAYDGSKLDKADQYIEKLEKALHLACADAADDCCPHELYDYEIEKCGDCPHDCEVHQDTERDIACWENYYLQEAYKGIMSNR
jgi:hypothetical protein